MTDFSEMRDRWDHRRWSEARRSQHESELMRHLKKYFDFSPSETMPYVLSVDRSGSYPETLITVRYFHPGSQQALCFDFDVWPWRDDPELVGAMLHIMDTSDTDARLVVGGWEAGEFLEESRPCG